MNRKPIFAANWKMNKGPSETEDFVKSFLSKLQGQDFPCEIVIAPPFVSLAKLAEMLHNANAVQNAHAIQIAAQNCSQFDNGAFTGEVSAGLAREAGAEFVIIGHSERREYFAETNETVNRKVHAVCEAGMVPIVCCGESLSMREAGSTNDFVSEQISAGLAGLSEEQASAVVLAYEPIWAIGTGKTATPEMAEEVCATLRGVVRSMYGEAVAEGMRILYGGSVKPENADMFFSEPDIDGALVGGAALDADSFAAIIGAAAR